jgi:hypothetical protein
MDERFSQAADALGSAVERGASLCRPIVDALPVTGAAISTIGGFLSLETVCSSDDRAGRVDELQLDLGEGPCWDALSQGRPVFEPDLAAPAVQRWPAFSRAAVDDGVGSIFAFPLLIGVLKVGALDLYGTEASSLDSREESDAAALADIAARQVLRKVVARVAGDAADSDDDTTGSRTVVHQATGMVIAQLDVNAADALLVLRGRAYSAGVTVREIARAVVDRSLDFSLQDGEKS